MRYGLRLMAVLALSGGACAAPTQAEQPSGGASGVEAAPAPTVDSAGARLYLGELPGGSATLAASIREDGFTDIYVCGSDGFHDTHSRWFCPDDLVDGDPEIVAVRDGWTMFVEREDPVVRGSLHSPVGQSYEFELQRTEEGVRAATFQHREGPNNCSGAIVWQRPGEPLEMVGTFCYPGGYAEQVSPILSQPPSPDFAAIEVKTTGDLADDVWLFNTLAQ